MKKIAIIVITYNRPADMLALAKNIAGLDAIDTLLEEVIIVNNASAASYALLEDFIAAHPQVPFKLITAAENLGVSKGRNFAIQQSTAPVLIMLDDDAELLGTDALVRTDVLMNHEGSTALISMKVLYYANRAMQINAFPHKDYKNKKDLQHFETYYFAGGAHIILRSVMDQVGMYPTDFFYGMEEYDLSYRILDAGYTIEYDAGIVMLHKESPEGRQPKREKLLGMWVNKSKVAWRYLPLLYFVSTAKMWSLFYLRRSQFDIIGFFKGWVSIIQIPFKEKRSQVNQKALLYLRKVGARLWY